VLIQAGLDGIHERREVATQRPGPLPTSLEAALTLLEQNAVAADWLGAELLSAYLLFKRAEIKGLQGLDDNEICRRYAEAY
jgi:glutamine synthetase